MPFEPTNLNTSLFESKIAVPFAYLQVLYNVKSNNANSFFSAMMCASILCGNFLLKPLTQRLAIIIQPTP